MARADYPLFFVTAPVKDEAGKLFGFIALDAYLINEKEANGSKKYEVVYFKDIKDLTITNFENLEEQEPVFDGDKCVNLEEVDEIYQVFDDAKEAADKKSKEVFEKEAVAVSYNSVANNADLYAFRKIYDEVKASIINERTSVLNNIESTVKKKRSR